MDGLIRPTTSSKAPSRSSSWSSPERSQACASSSESAPTRTPREDWIEAGLQALAVHGPSGVRVEVLAEELGVTKGGFYGQFCDRTAFLDELLDTWEPRSTDEVLDLVEAGPGDARDRMRRAGALTFGDGLLPIDLAVRSWARSDGGVAARLRRVEGHRVLFGAS